jgi:hypothetical protein
VEIKLIIKKFLRNRKIQVCRDETIEPFDLQMICPVKD